MPLADVAIGNAKPKTKAFKLYDGGERRLSAAVWSLGFVPEPEKSLPEPCGR